MRKVILIAIPLCIVAMTAAAQPMIVPPTLKDNNLKGPVHVVQTMRIFTVSDEEGDAFYEVETKSYDTAGRLTYRICSSPEILDDVFTYEYDHAGRLAKVSSLMREVYTNTYHYNAFGQLESIESRFTDDFEIYNHTLYVLKHDREGRPLQIESTYDGDSARNIYSYEYRTDGMTITDIYEKRNDTIAVENTYYNLQGAVDSVISNHGREKTINTYNDRGDLIKKQSTNRVRSYAITYRYGEESWQTDPYGNWKYRDVTLPTREECYERRTIIYYNK